MIRLELRQELRVKLAPEIDFYQKNDELLTASVLAGAVLEEYGDFGEHSAEARRRGYNAHVEGASKVIVIPAQFLDYDQACVHVGDLVRAVFSRAKMRQGVLTVNSLAYEAHHADIMGYSPFQKDVDAQAHPQLIAGFHIEDDFIPSHLIPHLATLSPVDGSTLKDLEQVFGGSISSPKPIKKRDIAFCAYDFREAKALMEDITYQRESA